MIPHLKYKTSILKTSRTKVCYLLFIEGISRSRWREFGKVASCNTLACLAHATSWLSQIEATSSIPAAKDTFYSFLAFSYLEVDVLSSSQIECIPIHGVWKQSAVKVLAASHPLRKFHEPMIFALHSHSDESLERLFLSCLFNSLLSQWRVILSILMNQLLPKTVKWIYKQENLTFTSTSCSNWPAELRCLQSSASFRLVSTEWNPPQDSSRSFDVLDGGCQGLWTPLNSSDGWGRTVSLQLSQWKKDLAYLKLDWVRCCVAMLSEASSTKRGFPELKGFLS